MLRMSLNNTQINTFQSPGNSFRLSSTKTHRFKSGGAKHAVSTCIRLVRYIFKYFGEKYVVEQIFSYFKIIEVEISLLDSVDQDQTANSVQSDHNLHCQQKVPMSSNET